MHVADFEYEACSFSTSGGFVSLRDNFTDDREACVNVHVDDGPDVTIRFRCAAFVVKSLYFVYNVLLSFTGQENTLMVVGVE